MNRHLFGKNLDVFQQNSKIFLQILMTILTLYFIMLQNGEIYFKNLAVFTPQDFKSMFDHFATLRNKGLK